MDKFLFIVGIVGIIALWNIGLWVRKTMFNSKKYLELKPKLDAIEEAIKEHDLKVENARAKAEKERADFELKNKKKR